MKKYALLAYLAFTAIPLYQAVDIWFNGAEHYIIGSDWDRRLFTNLGAHLFGQEYAYRGISVGLVVFALLIAAGLYLGSKSADNG